MKTFKNRFIVVCALFIGMIVGVSAQEATETSSQEETVVDTTPAPTTPVEIQSISHEDRTELHVAQEKLVRADSVFQYVLRNIVVKYRINTATHGLNIMSGEILPRNPTVDEGTPRTTNVRNQ